MDEKILRIVVSRLRRYGDEPINQEKLMQIRDDVYKATRTNKFAPFSNVKKWIKAARAEMRKAAKHSAKQSSKKPEGKKPQPHSKSSSIDDFVMPSVPKKVEDSVNLIKEEAVPQQMMAGQEVQLAKPTIVFDKVYLQGIKFEIAGIRSTMERVSRQLDRLEKELSSHEED
jgi:hypothetical protein